MYIQQISIKNYRNYKNFTMKFHKGLNVIIGANTLVRRVYLLR